MNQRKTRPNLRLLGHFSAPDMSGGSDRRAGGLSALANGCRAQDRCLHELYDRFLVEPLPDATSALVRDLQRGFARRKRARLVTHLAAMIAAVAMVGSFGWLLAGSYGHHAISAKTHDSAANGPRVNAGTVVVPVTAARSAAASDLAALPIAPDMSAFGLRLGGVRSIGTPESGAVQITYQASDGAQVNLYIAPSVIDSDELNMQQVGPVSIVVWQAGGRRYGLVGEIGRERLAAIGKALTAIPADRATTPEASDGPKAIPGAKPTDSRPVDQKPDSAVPKKAT